MLDPRLQKRFGTLDFSSLQEVKISIPQVKSKSSVTSTDNAVQRGTRLVLRNLTLRGQIQNKHLYFPRRRMF